MFKPVSDRVLVLRREVTKDDFVPSDDTSAETKLIIQGQGSLEKSTGGVYVAPTNAKEIPFLAEVVAVGPHVTQMKVGDTVLVHEVAGLKARLKTNPEAKETEYMIFHEKDVLVIC